MRVTIFQIKLVHTVIFWILSLCTVYALFSGIADRITMWTWIAVVPLLVESVVLGRSDGRAERIRGRRKAATGLAVQRLGAQQRR